MAVCSAGVSCRMTAKLEQAREPPSDVIQPALVTRYITVATDYPLLRVQNHGDREFQGTPFLAPIVFGTPFISVMGRRVSCWASDEARFPLVELRFAEQFVYVLLRHANRDFRKVALRDS